MDLHENDKPNPEESEGKKPWAELRPGLLTGDYTHVGFADETQYNTGRYRAISLTTLSVSDLTLVENDLATTIKRSGVSSEMRWKKVDGAKYGFAADHLFDYWLTRLQEGMVRVDTLVWDTEDPRHDVIGRDDAANLQDMFRCLVRRVVQDRWGSSTRWALFPDHGSTIDWPALQQSINDRGTEWTISHGVIRPIRDTSIELVQEVCSRECPLVQVADLFAGVAVFSYQHFDEFMHWRNVYRPYCDITGRMMHEGDSSLTNSQQARSHVLNQMLQRVKRDFPGISFLRDHGLETRRRSCPLNFWLYRPQHSSDVAPVRRLAS
jgi:hypothetical protein